MKTLLKIALLLVVVFSLIGAWLFFASGTGFSDREKILYIPANATTRAAVLDSIRLNNLVESEWAFDFVAARLSYWNRIRPGRYVIPKGMSIVTLVRKLRNGDQDPVKLVIKKFRTRADFARLVGAKMQADSAAFMAYLESADSLQPYGLSPDEALAMAIPNTYEFYWSASPRRVYNKLHEAYKAFWTADRVDKASAKGLTPVQVSVLASIVDEESNYAPEKGNIASVYLNRLRSGMPLQADPTVKFAVGDFTIKRVMQVHTQTPSPYNTYLNRGLPPGVICTPQAATLDAVLTAPTTPYLYFVASSKLDGTHDFSETYAQHLVKAKAFQEAAYKP